MLAAQKRKQFKPFTSTHQLPFEVAEYPNLFPPKPGEAEWRAFRIGSCEGLWRSTQWAYEILSIVNKQPGNGHLTDVFEWFENSCKRDGKALKILELLNSQFRRHLIDRRGFKPVGESDLIKSFRR